MSSNRKRRNQKTIDKIQVNLEYDDEGYVNKSKFKSFEDDFIQSQKTS